MPILLFATLHDIS